MNEALLFTLILSLGLGFVIFPLFVVAVTSGMLLAKNAV